MDEHDQGDVEQGRPDERVLDRLSLALLALLVELDDAGDEGGELVRGGGGGKNCVKTLA